jgi:hypothetical protein
MRGQDIAQKPMGGHNMQEKLTRGQPKAIPIQARYFMMPMAKSYMTEMEPSEE